MTFSIIAYHPKTGQTGVAVATANLAVGAVGFHVRAGVGTIVTQADPHPISGERGLRLLAETVPPEDLLRLLLLEDQGRQRRQMHVVDSHGNSAGWTGDECVSWAGHHTYPGFSVAGNMLVGSGTLEAMVASYQSGGDRPFAERLLTALESGQAAGGDKRGRQSAALYVVSTEVYADLDLRVDDHANPVSELRRVYQESQKPYYVAFRQTMPTSRQPDGIYDPVTIEEVVKRAQAAAGEEKK